MAMYGLRTDFGFQKDWCRTHGFLSHAFLAETDDEALEKAKEILGKTFETPKRISFTLKRSLPERLVADMRRKS